jgi:hypothetical protein
LAHELGHWHFHKGRVLYCGPGDVETSGVADIFNPERQADDFASDLILPNYLFRPLAVKLRKPTLSLVREIADEFQASMTATYLKLTQANLFPLIVVCHGKAGRRWFRRAQSIANWWFPRADLDSESFAFDMVFKKVSERSYPSKIGADAWFDFCNCDRYEIFEQSFHLPNEEVLTVLTLPADALV